MQIIILSIIFLLLTLKTSFIWLLYFFFIPGYIILKKLKYSKEKCIIYSLPLSLLTLHWPYFLLSRIGIPIPSSYFYIIPAIFIILYIKYDYNNIKNSISNIKIKIPVKGKKLYTLLITLFCFASFYYVFSPFLSDDSGVPLSLGARYVYETEIVTESILERGLIPKWSYEWYSGMHMLYSYPPLSYIILSNACFASEAWKMQNLYIFAFTFLFAIFFYMFLIRIKAGKIISIPVAFLSACLPPLIRANDVFKSTSDFTFLIIFLFSLFIGLNFISLK